MIYFLGYDGYIIIRNQLENRSDPFLQMSKYLQWIDGSVEVIFQWTSKIPTSIQRKEGLERECTEAYHASQSI